MIDVLHTFSMRICISRGMTDIKDDNLKNPKMQNYDPSSAGTTDLRDINYYPTLSFVHCTRQFSRPRSHDGTAKQ